MIFVTVSTLSYYADCFQRASRQEYSELFISDSQYKSYTRKTDLMSPVEKNKRKYLCKCNTLFTYTGLVTRCLATQTLVKGLFNFWPSNVVKRGRCCPSVCPSVRQSHLWVMP